MRMDFKQNKFDKPISSVVVFGEIKHELSCCSRHREPLVLKKRFNIYTAQIVGVLIDFCNKINIAIILTDELNALASSSKNKYYLVSYFCLIQQKLW